MKRHYENNPLVKNMRESERLRIRKLFSTTDMKYAHLIDEPINEGKEYHHYGAKRKKLEKEARQERMKILKVERAERIKRCGKIKFNKRPNFIF